MVRSLLLVLFFVSYFDIVYLMYLIRRILFPGIFFSATYMDVY